MFFQILRATTVVAIGVISLSASAPAVQDGSSAELIVFQSDRDGNSDIFLMNGDGTGVRALARHPAEDRDPFWFPDGRRVGFVSNRDGNQEIYSVRVDGTDLRRLTNDKVSNSGAAVSPDGRRLAFAAGLDFQPAEVYLVNADGSSQQRLTDHPKDDWRPVWSPDGSHIAFLSVRDAEGNSDGSGEVFVAPAKPGAIARRLTKQLRKAQSMSWSRSGREIAFAMVGNRRSEISVAAVDGSSERNLSALTQSQLDSVPVWSPDGKLIAFQMDNGIGLMAPDGSGRRKISLPDRPSMGPASWAPDSQSVIYSAWIGGNWDVVRVPVNGGVERPLNSGKGAELGAQFGPGRVAAQSRF
jgi:TolB protein